jgi:hypothetical protein
MVSVAPSSDRPRTASVRQRRSNSADHCRHCAPNIISAHLKTPSRRAHSQEVIGAATVRPCSPRRSRFADYRCSLDVLAPEQCTSRDVYEGEAARWVCGGDGLSLVLSPQRLIAGLLLLVCDLYAGGWLCKVLLACVAVHLGRKTLSSWVPWTLLERNSGSGCWLRMLGVAGCSVVCSSETE